MLATFRSVNDRRFSLLRNVFLNFLHNLLNFVEQHQGNFKKDADQEMFTSWQAYEGLKISVNVSIKLSNFFFDISLSVY